MMRTHTKPFPYTIKAYINDHFMTRTYTRSLPYTIKAYTKDKIMKRTHTHKIITLHYKGIYRGQDNEDNTQDPYLTL